MVIGGATIITWFVTAENYSRSVDSLAGVIRERIFQTVEYNLFELMADREEHVKMLAGMAASTHLLPDTSWSTIDAKLRPVLWQVFRNKPDTFLIGVTGGRGFGGGAEEACEDEFPE
eukprot:jgi/Mesvir1/3089/Mv06706-RA.1